MNNFLVLAVSLMFFGCGQNYDSTSNEIELESNTDYNPNPKSIELNN